MDNNRRLASLDALRGFDMLFIMGFSNLVVALCTLLPCGADCWLAQQMTHVEWNGLHHHDTIFPLFLFIAGISFPFSLAKSRSQGKSKAAIYRKIVRRGLILVLLGLVTNGLFQFEFDSIRIPSVLARIGLAWMFAALLSVDLKVWVRAVIAGAILLGYWGLSMIPAPDAVAAAGGAFVDPLSKEGCLVGYVDRCLIPGHLYAREGGIFDPEGILSTLPAIVTALLGIFTGEFVRRQDLSGNRKTLIMFGAAAVLLAAGLLWSNVLPVNKKLWSSTFVLVVGAYSLAMFALFYWIIDVRGWDGWIFPFKVIGMNSITIYILPRFISLKYAVDFFLGGVLSNFEGAAYNAIYYAAYILAGWLILYFFYRKKVFLKV